MALKASELRIGNWHWGDGKPREINAFDIKDLSDDPQDDFYQPIPLTEEWLLKFGLTKTNGGNFSCADICVYDNLENINISLENGDIGVELRCPKYVHQLQNLYFALTGEELKMK